MKVQTNAAQWTNASPRQESGKPATPKVRGEKQSVVRTSDKVALVEAPQLVGATLREQRRRLNLTLETVARRTGITKGFLSEIERDKAAPSVATLMSLRAALSLSVASVFVSSLPRIVRAQHRQNILLGGTDIDYSLLSARDAHRATVVWGRLAPGAQSGPDMHALSADEELIFVLAGSLKITLDGAAHVLQSGDAFTFDPRRPHRYENPSKTIANISICVIAPPPRDNPERNS
jgi:transcriptional regulator with XRE-family HTH domain